MIRLSNIKIDIDDMPKDTSLDKKFLMDKASKKLGISKNDIEEFSIYKQSIDARKKERIIFVYSVDMSVKNEEKILKRNKKDLVKISTNRYIDVKEGNLALKNRPVVVGAGPAGLFATLLLAQRGYRPILLERGKDVDNRSRDIEKFWCGKEFNPNSNVQFGEGGAGTFSDGKLTTRIKDELRCQKVLSELVNFGADEEILYAQKPHIGTDILKVVIKNMRKELIFLGADVRFDSLVTKIELENSTVKSVRVNDDYDIQCSDVIFAIGHSARDTYEMLYKSGAYMEQKPFAMGVRIEHPQSLINSSQYGKYSDHKRLGAADYRLTAHTSEGRSVYTFCMCPGGEVIASASSEGYLVTNGMSEHKRDKQNANSGLLVNIDCDDFGSEEPLAGMRFQQKYEKLAFELGGRNYYAPIQKVGDFLEGRKTEIIGDVKPSYSPGVTPSNLENCMPDFVVKALKEGIHIMNTKLEGFSMPDAIMTGVETRSSAPVRIKRNKDTLSSISINNLYPCGEGAGYAGGIVSAAVDGIKCAEKIIEKYYIEKE